MRMQLRPDYLTSEDRVTSVKLNRVLDIMQGLSEALVERAKESKKLMAELEKEQKELCGPYYNEVLALIGKISAEHYYYHYFYFDLMNNNKNNSSST